VAAFVESEFDEVPVVEGEWRGSRRGQVASSVRRAVAKRPRTIVVYVALVGVCSLVVAGVGGAAAGSVRRSAATASCPASALPGGPLDVEAVLAALRRQMPSLYKGLTDMGKPVPINARTYEVDGVVRLGFSPRPAFARGLRTRALRICERSILDRSWAVAVHLTRVQLPASNRVVFLAKTSRGWAAWYHD
jgi:hypothetical protein